MMPKALDNWVRGMIMEYVHNLTNVLGFSKLPRYIEFEGLRPI